MICPDYFPPENLLCSTKISNLTGINAELQMHVFDSFSISSVTSNYELSYMIRNSSQNQQRRHDAFVYRVPIRILEAFMIFSGTNAHYDFHFHIRSKILVFSSNINSRFNYLIGYDSCDVIYFEPLLRARMMTIIQIAVPSFLFYSGQRMYILMYYIICNVYFYPVQYH